MTTDTLYHREAYEAARDRLASNPASLTATDFAQLGLISERLEAQARAAHRKATTPVVKAAKRPWYEAAADSVANAIMVALQPRDDRLTALDARVSALESRKLPTYEGVHEEGKAYVSGSLVTRAGSLWLAMADTTDTPGNGATHWRLVVKRGQVA